MLYPKHSMQDALLRFDIGRALLTTTARADLAALFAQHHDPQPLIDAYATLFQNTVHRAHSAPRCMHVRDPRGQSSLVVGLIFRPRTNDLTDYEVGLSAYLRSGLVQNPVDAALLAVCHHEDRVVWGNPGAGSLRDRCGSAIVTEKNPLKVLELPGLYTLAEQGLRDAGVPGDLADHLLQGLRGPDGKPYTPPVVDDEMWQRELFDTVCA